MMAAESDLDGRLRALMRDVLDREVGPHAAWADAPAALRIAEQSGRRRVSRQHLRLLAIAAVLVVGGTVLVGALLRAPTLPPLARPTNGWVAFSANGKAGPRLELTELDPHHGDADIYIVRDGVPLRQIVGSGDDGLAQYCPAFSPDGTRLAYMELDARNVPPTEPPRPAPVAPNSAKPPRAAPPTDPTFAAIAAPTAGTATGSGEPIWTIVVVPIDANGDPVGPGVRLPVEGSPEWCAEWAPDGQRLAYATSSPGVLRIVPLVGPSTTFDPGTRGGSGGGLEWSPDGATIAWIDELWGLWLVPVDGGAARKVPVDHARTVSWSPDGARLAVGSDAMVEVLTTAGTHITTFAVSEPDDFGPGPAWSADGRWIAHLDGSQVVLVPVGGGANRILSLDATGVAGVPALGPDFTFAGWSPDGERFLLVGAVPDAGNVLLSIPIDPGTSGLALTKGTAAIRGSAREISWQPVFP